MKVSKSPGKDNELFLQFLGDNSHYLVTITVMILNEWGELGVCKSANPCLFFTKSVDPPIFLFKFETAKFEKFLWRIFTATVYARSLFGSVRFRSLHSLDGWGTPS